MVASLEWAFALSVNLPFSKINIVVVVIYKKPS